MMPGIKGGGVWVAVARLYRYHGKGFKLMAFEQMSKCAYVQMCK